jgi:hypothetical protein
MFADYRVPQILREYNILTYSELLAEKIDNFIELEYSCQYEVEIRALTVIAVEKILEAIKNSEILKNQVNFAY